MNPYAARPWLKLYPPGMPPAPAMDYPDALAMFRAAVARAPDGPAVHYFDTTLTWREVDADSDALAAALGDRGVALGDRVALDLQNTPAFLIGMLAAWKAGAIAVPVNPMNREREVSLLLADATPKALICHDTLHRDAGVRPEPLPRAATPNLGGLSRGTAGPGA